MSTVNHGIDRVRATFDDESLIADAGLLLVATVAVRLGLEALINSTVRLTGRVGGAQPGRKALTLIHAMISGAYAADMATEALRAERDARSSERDALAAVMWDAEKHRLPDSVAVAPQKLARLAGFEIPTDRTFIFVKGDGISREHVFSMEKLTTLLAVHRYEGEFENALDAMRAIYEVGGKGHSCGIYSHDADHIHRLGLAAPVSRIMVRQPQSKANAGAFNNGMPMTSSMGCGTWGGNVTSENVHLKHYLNTTWVSVPIPEDKPSDEELFGDFYDATLEPEGEVITS